MKQRVRGEKRLKATDIKAMGPGAHEDGGGLRLVVEPSASRRWVLRVTIAGKRHNRGLGPYPLVSLEAARDKAVDIRRAAREGRDLAIERRHQRAKTVTFRQAFETFFELRQQGLSNAKHLVSVHEARRSARALADVVGDADGGTADPIHVWRVPGTLNWPKKSKAARGRPLTPQPVHLDRAAP